MVSTKSPLIGFAGATLMLKSGATSAFVPSSIVGAGLGNLPRGISLYGRSKRFFSALSISQGSENNAPESNPKEASMANNIIDRRTTLSQIIAATGFSFATTQPAFSADEDVATTASLSVLETRMLENAITPPPYGMEDTDIKYPPYFKGSFTAISKTSDIFAPCGFELFSGGKAAYDSTVEREINKGEALEYKARFVASSNVGGIDAASGGVGDDYYIAADRAFNAKEIAKAAMGSYSVVDVSVATPNRFSCLLAPPSGEGGLIAVDILTIARKSEPISPTKFACSEVVRQIVSPASSRAGAATPKLVKEIETISIYDVGNNADLESVNQIPCKQRTATYLVPSQTDPVALKLWQMSRGRPVDVRYYDVVYTRV